MATWPLQRDCANFYGDPRGANGKASAKWESANLVLVACPWVLRYDGKPVKGIRIHRECAESLKRVLDAIWQRVGKSQAEIDRIGMSVYGGSYNFRAMRGGKSLSMHSYGCAIDFDPARNALGDKTPAMDRRVIEEFEREGWEWGGHWTRADGMHFQAARTRANPPRLKPASQAEPMPKVVSKTEIERLQTALKGLGYHEVGMIDGIMGSKTRGALLAFKADNGLPLMLDIDNATWAALSKAKPRPVAPERAVATEAPSEAAKAAKAAQVAGGAAVAVGATDAALKPAGGLSGVTEWLTGAGEAAGALQTVLSPLRDLAGLVAANWPVALLLGGVGLFFLGRRIFRDELESFRRGEWS